MQFLAIYTLCNAIELINKKKIRKKIDEEKTTTTTTIK
jgi:hypothetical protein